MKNLQTKTKAQLIEIIERQERELNDTGLSPNEEMLDEFTKLLKIHISNYQLGLLSKVEIYQAINKVYDAYMFAKGVRKDEED